MKYLSYVLSLFVLGVVIGIGLFYVNNSNVDAGGRQNVWQTTDEGSWSDCQPGEGFDRCEGGQGTQTRTITQTCVRTEGHGEDECEIVRSCPDGYEYDDGKCEKDLYAWRYADKVGPIWNRYCPSSDSSYTSTNSNKPCKRWVKVGEDEVDPTYTPETRELGEEQGCPIDPEPEACPTPEPSPTPEPTPTPTEPPRVEIPLTEAGAPQCPNGVPLKLPANVHVVRSGSDATVNFFVPEGNNANIYYKEVSANGWQHAARDIPVTGGYVSYTIHDLDPNLGYTFGVQAANSCAGGETVLAVVVDGPASVTFPMNYWEWL